jgi:hypothetical protein
LLSYHCGESAGLIVAWGGAGEGPRTALVNANQEVKRIWMASRGESVNYCRGESVTG